MRFTMLLFWLSGCGISLAAEPVAFTVVPSEPTSTEEPWYGSPRLAAMTGFIYEPKSAYTMDQWRKGLADRFDADRWAQDFAEAGCSYVIFYSKWIDGLCFWDTKTTGFKTQRDFVKELSDACHRHGVRIIYYWNHLSDGNPEFDKWSVFLPDGNPSVWSPFWPCRRQTLTSPFRQVGIQQLRELFTEYGPVGGIWFDVPTIRSNESNRWVEEFCQKVFDAPFGEATPQQKQELIYRLQRDYFDEVRVMRDNLQPQCVFTANGSGARSMPPTRYNQMFASRLDYLTHESHQFDRIEGDGRRAWVFSKPLELGLLVSDSWFVSLEGAGPGPAMTEKGAIASAAAAFCQGANVYMAMTPSYAGPFPKEVVQRTKAIGSWFRKTEPVLAGAEPHADVAIVLGAATTGERDLAAQNTFWSPFQADQRNSWDETVAMSRALAGAGIFSRTLYSTSGSASWPKSLSGYGAILLPERAPLDEKHAQLLRDYVRQGGTLVAFGHASMLDGTITRQQDYLLGDVLGVEYQGEVTFPSHKLKTAVTVDSVYSSEYAAEHLVDGLATSWASANTPMPHWAEIMLAEPADVATVELIARNGPYRLADLDIEVKVADAWKVAKSIRDADAVKISVKLDQPVRTHAIRVKVLRELFEGNDRQLADLEAIRVLDVAGRDLSTSSGAKPVPVVAEAAELRDAVAETSLSFLPMAVLAKPTSAEVIARFEEPISSPAKFRNRCGKGQAILVTTSEASFAKEHPFWRVLRQLTIGQPTLICDPQVTDRYRIILTQIDGRHVLHAIDREAAAGQRPRVRGPSKEKQKIDYQAGELTLSLSSERLGGVTEARLIGAKEPLLLKGENGFVTFTVRPDPVASVVLQ